MALLFVDSTYDLTLGILDDELNWLDLKHHSGQKSSAILQKEAYSLCGDHGIKPAELKKIISVAGPGFYTGLRLSEGFADIFKFFQVTTHTFYTYELPLWSGFNEGVWMTKAYRGEYFFHSWKGQESSNTLLSLKELPEMLSRLPHVYIHSEAAIDENVIKNLKSSTSTFELLKKDSKKLFSKILSAELVRDSFYFRAPEDEFKVST